MPPERAHRNEKKPTMQNTVTKSLRRITIACYLGAAAMANPSIANATWGATPGITAKIEAVGAPNSNLSVTDLRMVKANDLIRIQAEITNNANSTQQVYYRCKWLDKNGFVVGDEETWKPVQLYSGQKQIIQIVSPYFQVHDFRIELQDPASIN